MSNWEESKHPRDAEGKFTDKGQGTPAERKRLEELGIKAKDEEKFFSAEEYRLKDMGINIDRKIDNTHQKVYNKINVEKRDLKDFKSLQNILSGKNLDDLVAKSKFAFFSKGREDLIIKPLLDELGFSALPQKVDAKTFEDMKKDHLFLSRGVTSSEYVEKFKNGDMFVGLGVNGSGVYTTTRKEKAESYAKQDGAVIDMLLDKNAKIADGIELTKNANELLFSLKTGNDTSGNPIDIGLNKDAMIKIGEGNNKRFVTLLALAGGYDAINVGNGDYIILNRSAVIVKGD